MTSHPITTTAVERRPNRSGQSRTFIVGTRVRVLDVYALAELQGQTPDQIVEAFPHLSLAQVHAALSYYFANRDEIVRELREEHVLADRFRMSTGHGPLHVKLAGEEAGRDSVSS
jgi:uncharacterized protein (DUF433 family)